MRRHDKKIHMVKVNKLFEQRCNETKTSFNWGGKYANEDVHEGDVVETREEDDEIAAANYNQEYSVKGDVTDKNYTDPYKIKEDDIDETSMISLGDDIESVSEVDTTDVSASTWFSDVDGERSTDKIFN